MKKRFSGHAKIAVSALLALMLSRAARADDCVRTSPMTMLQFSDLVVAGELTSVRDSVDREDDSEWRILTVDPSIVWKGATRQALRILCSWDCLPSFEIGGSYIFYASIKDGRLFTGRCWRNNSFEAALFDRFLLPEPLWMRELHPPAPVATADLVALLNHPEYVVAETAARDFLWLAENPEGVVTDVVEILRSPDALRPQLAALALTELDASEAVTDLEWAFANGEPILATAALSALSALDIDAPRREARIEAALRHVEPTLRYQAVNLFADDALRKDAGLSAAAAIDVLKRMRARETNADVILRIDIRIGDLIEAVGRE